MLGRTSALLLGIVTLAGCTQPELEPGCCRPGAYGYGGIPPQPGAPGAAQAPAGTRVAILLPLTGTLADLGHAMLNAAQMSFQPGAGTPSPLDVEDTAGTPDGAARAAQAAIASGDGLILGPLTSAETNAVAPVARAAHVSVLAFTNDPAAAQPGVWTLGITPGQQVSRVVAYAQAQGRTQFAALLPPTDFGRAMGAALTQVAAQDGLAPPATRQYSPGMAGISAAARDISDYADRRGVVDQQVRAAKALDTADGRRQAAELNRQPVPPPPFDALLLADTGEALPEIASLLPYYDIGQPGVKVLGPMLWLDPRSGSGALPGAWFAAPDPAARADFVARYSAQYGAPPPVLADLAYDAGALAQQAAGAGRFSADAMTGLSLTGTDGALRLRGDGSVARALAVFQVQAGGPQIVDPAPPEPQPGA